jgi:hypothetical protein
MTHRNQTRVHRHEQLSRISASDQALLNGIAYWPVIRSAADASTATQSPTSGLDTALRNSLTELVTNYLQAGGLRIDINISINLNIVPQEGSS